MIVVAPRTASMTISAKLAKTAHFGTRTKPGQQHCWQGAARVNYLCHEHTPTVKARLGSQGFILVSAHSLARSLVRPFVLRFIRSLVHSFVRSFVLSSINAFGGRFWCLFSGLHQNISLRAEQQQIAKSNPNNFHNLDLFDMNEPVFIETVVH